jgi:nucleoside-diphosphate-sugar epimerase
MTIRKVFITGINGYIGGTIAQLLLKQGYEVSGLVRNPAHVAPLAAAGIRTITGTIDNAPSLRAAAQEADAVIHTANVNDPYSIDTLIDALKGTNKTLIHTSGSSILGKKEYGALSDVIYSEEDAVIPTLERVHWTGLNDHVLHAATLGIRSIVIIPTMVYGIGTGIHRESIQLPMLWKAVKEKGRAIYVEAGASTWSNVHIADLAQLYLLALEKAPAGSVFYAENGSASFKEIAVAMSEKPGIGAAVSISIDEAVALFGADMAHYGLASNSRVSADKARRELGWEPAINGIFDHIKHEIQ